MTRAFHWLRWLPAPVIVLLAVAMLWRQLHGVSMSQLHVAWAGTSWPAIALSLLGTALSFACLAGYERFATRYVVPGRVPLGAALRVGALSHAISNTLGFHVLTGGALRYRAYRNLGLGVADIARVVAVVGVCVGTGVVVVSALALLWVQFGAGGIAGVLLSIAALLLLGLALAHRATHQAGSVVLPLMLRSAGPLCVLGVVEMAAAIAALYVLLPAGMAPAPFALVFVGAMLLGIVSHAPGVLGVFEATILAALPAGHHAQALVALLLYRVLYNLLPFVLAAAVLVFEPMRSRRLADPISD